MAPLHASQSPSVPPNASHSPVSTSQHNSQVLSTTPIISKPHGAFQHISQRISSPLQHISSHSPTASSNETQSSSARLTAPQCSSTHLKPPSVPLNSSQTSPAPLSAFYSPQHLSTHVLHQSGIDDRLGMALRHILCLQRQGLPNLLMRQYDCY